MANLAGFNASTVEPMAEFEPIPADKYLAVITKSEEKPTRSGQGKYLEFTFQVIDGEYKGRLVWARLNTEHPNALTVKLAKSELSAICRAVGIITPNDSCELHNVPIIISVTQKKGTDSVVRNVIKGYAKREAVADRPAQAVNSTPPWRR